MSVRLLEMITLSMGSTALAAIYLTTGVLMAAMLDKRKTIVRLHNRFVVAAVFVVAVSAWPLLILPLLAANAFSRLLDYTVKRSHDDL